MTCPEMCCGMPQGKIREALDWLAGKLQQEPESEATKKLNERLDALNKEYDGIPDIVSKYATAYKDFVACGASYEKAATQWQDLEQWIKDVEKTIKDPIDALRGSYETKESELKYKSKSEEDNFNSLKSCLKQAESAATRASEDFEEAKKYEDEAKRHFTTLTTLHKDGDTFKKAGNKKALYAVYLEFKAEWEEVTHLKSPDQLKGSLTDKLLPLVKADCEHFFRHADWLKKEKDAKTAASNYKAFKDNRSKAFIRDAQDTVSASTTTETTTESTG